MTEAYKPPLLQLAEKLASNGEYECFESLEPKLVAQFGPTAVKLFAQDRETRRRVDNLCKTARAKSND